VREAYGEFKNTRPNNWHLSKCSCYTFALLGHMQPKLIICLGIVASMFIAGFYFDDYKQKIIWNRGKVYQWRRYIILPIYHPSAHFHKKSNKEENYQYIANNISWIHAALQNLKLVV
jgi:uracil-DNA glycosylase family 4